MFYKVTQVRSILRMPWRTRDVLKTLGLGKVGSQKYYKASPGIAGQLYKVKELVNVEMAEEYKSKAQIKAERKTDAGFSVVGSKRV